jgi:hypothetical protein
LELNAKAALTGAATPSNNEIKAMKKMTATEKP